MLSLEFLVGASAALATFVASVMGDEQEQRLRNGTFGAIAGSSMGGFAALLKNQPELLLVGVLGSTSGAFLGWLVYLGLSLIAATKIGRRMLAYQLGGLRAVLNELKLDTIEEQMRALQSWGDSFRRLVGLQKNDLVGNSKGEGFEITSRLVFRGWMIAITDVFNLIFELARDREHKSRMAIIVFGEKDGKLIGRYWIRYSGSLGRPSRC